MKLSMERLPVEFLRVLGVRSQNPGVLAFVSGRRVTWNPRGGWSCACGVEFCFHIKQVRSLIDPRITGEKEDK